MQPCSSHVDRSIDHRHRWADEARTSGGSTRSGCHTFTDTDGCGSVVDYCHHACTSIRSTISSRAAFLFVNCRSIPGRVIIVWITLSLCKSAFQLAGRGAEFEIRDHARSRAPALAPMELAADYSHAYLHAALGLCVRVGACTRAHLWCTPLLYACRQLCCCYRPGLASDATNGSKSITSNSSRPLVPATARAVTGLQCRCCSRILARPWIYIILTRIRLYTNEQLYLVIVAMADVARVSLARATRNRSTIAIGACPVHTIRRLVSASGKNDNQQQRRGSRCRTSVREAK